MVLRSVTWTLLFLITFNTTFCRAKHTFSCVAIPDVSLTVLSFICNIFLTFYFWIVKIPPLSVCCLCRQKFDRLSIFGFYGHNVRAGNLFGWSMFSAGPSQIFVECYINMVGEKCNILQIYSIVMQTVAAIGYW